MDFINFYQRFFKRLSNIVVLLIFILRTTPRPITTTVRRFNKAYNGEVNSGDKAICEKSEKIKRVKTKIIKNLKNYFSSKVPANFIWLRIMFTKALILYHFNLEYHIWIETNTFSFAIGKLLS